MSGRIDLPDKLYFKIGEVAELAGVRPHVLRYWESEFPSIRPQKSRSGQRLYRRQDLETVLAVRHLLYDRKFTIEGARQHLEQAGVAAALPPPPAEAVAEAARKAAEAEVKDAADRARAGAVRWYEERLLALKADAKRYLAELDRLGADSGERGDGARE